MFRASTVAIGTFQEMAGQQLGVHVELQANAQPKRSLRPSQFQMPRQLEAAAQSVSRPAQGSTHLRSSFWVPYLGLCEGEIREGTLIFRVPHFKTDPSACFRF